MFFPISFLLRKRPIFIFKKLIKINNKWKNNPITEEIYCFMFIYIIHEEMSDKLMDKKLPILIKI